MQTQNNILEKILRNIKNKNNILLHGPGGVGKSYLICQIVTTLQKYSLNIYVTATTGIAAVNLNDGFDENSFSKTTTLHKFAGASSTGGTESCIKLLNHVKKSKIALERWSKCNILVIDEISMLGAKFFENLNFVAQQIRNNASPFGGIQLIVSGDFLQLPPVKDEWIFKSKTWANLQFVPYVLETPKRYNDLDFFKFLLRIRMGEQTPNDLKLLKARVVANVKFNQYLANLKNKNSEIVKPTMFHSKRCDVDEFNNNELQKLSGQLHTFKAEDAFIIIEGDPKKESYTKILDYEMPSTLHFKIGAQVMLKANLDVSAGLANGSRGVVCGISQEYVEVKFLGGAKHKIEFHAREFSDEYCILKRKQIPLALAFSMTIHKSQGSTLDYATINLGPTIFSPGQAYVALSRCSTFKGLFITQFDSSCLVVDKEAIAYSKKIRNEYFDREYERFPEKIFLLKETKKLCKDVLNTIFFLGILLQI